MTFSSMSIPTAGIAAGQRWVHALEEAATRCEAVLFVVSREWLGSKWCPARAPRSAAALVHGDTRSAA
jgi:hypothetical protein